MIPNNNLNVLPFYDSVDEQLHRKFYAYGDIYKLICSSGKILPFQIVREHRVADITVAELIRLSDENITDVLSEMTTAGLVVKHFDSDGYDLVVNNGALVMPTLQMYAEQYYLKLSDGVDTWFSEVFTVVNDLSKYVKIEYFDRDNLEYTGGHIDYSHPYRNYCYVQTEIGKPEYPFKEEAQDRDGYLFVEQQISEKKYKFEFLAPEFLCDALRVVRMHDYVRIYDKGKVYDVENIIFEPKWKEQGNLAVMEVEFECDTIIKKIGKGFVDNGNGDFNEDFNEDFNNTNN